MGITSALLLKSALTVKANKYCFFEFYSFSFFIFEIWAKGKVVPVCAMKECRRSRGMASLILYLGTRCRWVVQSMAVKFYFYIIHVGCSVMYHFYKPNCSMFIFSCEDFCILTNIQLRSHLLECISFGSRVFGYTCDLTLCPSKVTSHLAGLKKWSLTSGAR